MADALNAAQIADFIAQARALQHADTVNALTMFSLHFTCFCCCFLLLLPVTMFGSCRCPSRRTNRRTLTWPEFCHLCTPIGCSHETRTASVSLTPWWHLITIGKPPTLRDLMAANPGGSRERCSISLHGFGYPCGYTPTRPFKNFTQRFSLSQMPGSSISAPQYAPRLSNSISVCPFRFLP
jgi:hypothetical protein